MCDCGCGGKCGGNCGQPSKIITKELNTVTSNMFYKGSAISCADDSSIDIADGEGFNSILQKILTKLCSLSGGRSYLAWSDTNKSISGVSGTIELSRTPTINLFNLLPGEGIRISMAVNNNLSLLVSPGYITASIFGNNGSPTVDFSLASPTLNAGAAVGSYKLDIELFRDKTTTNKIYQSWMLISNTGVDNNASFSSERTVPFDLDVYPVGIVFSGETNNASDTLNIEHMSVEHLRP